jgi:dihydrofolate synthase / folylpolyglutamate synthase
MADSILPPDLNSSASDPSIDQFLAQYERFGIDLGLDRVLHLLDRLGNPQKQVPIIHVAGSNGKGSVCAYLSSVLAVAGYRVGRYISPHLVSWCERICINNQPISGTALRQVLQYVAAKIDPHRPSPTQFEVITAAAWSYFAAEQVDVAVIEVGLGGRLDATNVCDQPLITVITSLSLEHWQRLGPTLADIAREKAGILKPHRPAVIGPIPPETQAVVKARLQAQNCPTTWVEPAHALEGISPSQQVSLDHPWAQTDWADYQGIQFPLALPGQFQLTNAALAIASLLQLRQQGWQISDAAIAEGMGKTRWPGRLQWLTWQGRQLLIDGAHNPAAAVVLREYIDSLGKGKGASHPPQPIAWVMGMLTTKDHGDIFKALLRPGDQLCLVPVPGHSGAATTELAALSEQICPDLGGCYTFTNLQTGLEAACNLTGQPQIVLCGSLYLIGEFLKPR